MPITYDPAGYSTPTFDQLVEEVLSNLQGYTLSPDQVTYLTSDVASTDTQIKIAAQVGIAAGMGIGMVEINDELMQVINYDEPTSTLTILPRGRGWRGTTASVHSNGDTVTVSPLVPRSRVKAAINDVVNMVYSLGIPAVATTDITYVPGPTLAWGIPDDLMDVLDVRYRDVFGNWIVVRGWEVTRSASVGDFPTGSALRITEIIPIPTTVRVTYGKRATPLYSGSSPLTDTGLSVSAKDLLIYGAMARLIPALDAGRLGMQYVPADELDQPRQLGSAVAISKEFNARFTDAVNLERLSFQNQYPARLHYVSAR